MQAYLQEQQDEEEDDDEHDEHIENGENGATQKGAEGVDSGNEEHEKEEKKVRAHLPPPYLCCVKHGINAASTVAIVLEWCMCNQVCHVLQA